MATGMAMVMWKWVIGEWEWEWRNGHGSPPGGTIPAGIVGLSGLCRG